MHHRAAGSDASTRPGHVALITTSSPGASSPAWVAFCGPQRFVITISVFARTRTRQAGVQATVVSCPLTSTSSTPMAPLAVKIKHAGKVHDVQLDPDLPPAVFKDAVYQVTGVPPDRMKVMIKGGILKVRALHACICHELCLMRCIRVQDDTDWRKVAPKAVSTSPPSCLGVTQLIA